jgi:hypothetical protein
MKKSGILLAVLLLATFTLTFSSAASAQAPQAPAAAVQPVTPLPDFLTAPAVQTPAAAPANGTGEIDWLSTKDGVGVGKPACRCDANSDCRNTTHFCCFFPGQHCGVCCIA